MLRRLLPGLVPVLGWLLGAASAPAAPATAPAAPPHPEFVRQVDLSAFRLLAVQHRGSFKTLDTLARSALRHMSGRDTFAWDNAGGESGLRQDAAFTYLDIMIRPEAYDNARIIYVKEKILLDKLILPVKDQLDQDVREAIFADRRVSPAFLAMPEVQTVLNDLSGDVMRTAKKVQILLNNAAYADPRLLRHQMRVIPPPDAQSPDQRWYSIEDLLSARLPDDSAHAEIGGERALPGVSPALQQELTAQWTALRQAWVAQDAAGVNAAADALAAELRTINPAVYPAGSKLSLEHVYYRYNKLMWTWALYLLALVLLLMGIVYSWRNAKVVGVILFGLAFLLHTAACGIRWYLAGRIPNTNMFEAVTAAAWFGCAVAVFFELAPLVYRQWLSWVAAWVMVVGGFIVWLGSLRIAGVPVDAWQQWSSLAIAALIVFSVGCMALIALVVARRAVGYHGVPLFAASAVSMVALMCGQFMKVSLDSDIGQAMPILNDLWLYVHTNMIIASYALIGLACCTAALYLAGRMLTMSWSWQEAWPVWIFIVLPAILVPLPALPDLINRIVGVFRKGPDPLPTLLTFGQMASAWAPFAIVLGMYAVARLVRLMSAVLLPEAAKRARVSWDGVGASVSVGRDRPVPVLAGNVPATAHVASLAPAPVGGAARGETDRAPGKADASGVGLARVFDGATMLLLELSFITLWTGIIMGAIWADHSWGRPWGWDPKEVFALNTWIIFLILVHVRLKVADKALWTAVLTVLGAAVMMFNWVVVNFFIVGLHSYA